MMTVSRCNPLSLGKDVRVLKILAFALPCMLQKHGWYPIRHTLYHAAAVEESLIKPEGLDAGLEWKHNARQLH